MGSTRFGMLLGVLAAGACFALPAVAGAQAPTQDSVVGTGAIADGSSLVANVTSGPSGENPTGTVSFSTAGGIPFQSTSVACLSVTGNTATFVLSLAPNLLGIPGVRFTVVDNSATGSPDTIVANAALPATTPCTPEPGLGGGPQELTAGDLVVIDATPLPTSRDQCKNGGWRTFGDTFKNQGQCVAFVQRGPQP